MNNIFIKITIIFIMLLSLFNNCRKNNNIINNKIDNNNDTINTKIDDKNIVEAVKKGNITEINEIIQKGTDINSRDENGDTILMIACFNENINIIKLLLENGASVNLKSKGKFKYYSDEYDAVILVRENRLKDDIIDILLNYNYNNINYNLQRAVEIGDLEKVKILINKIDDINLLHIEYNPYEPTTLLMIACYYGYIEIVDLLIQKGADINAETNYSGFSGTPLSFAVEKNNLDIVKLLIKKGANVNGRCYAGEEYLSILQLACYNDYKDIVSILIDNGADVNIKDGSRVTALSITLKNRNDEIIKILKKAGAK